MPKRLARASARFPDAEGAPWRKLESFREEKRLRTDRVEDRRQPIGYGADLDNGPGDDVLRLGHPDDLAAAMELDEPTYKGQAARAEYELSTMAGQATIENRWQHFLETKKLEPSTVPDEEMTTTFVKSFLLHRYTHRINGARPLGQGVGVVTALRYLNHVKLQVWPILFPEGDRFLF